MASLCILLIACRRAAELGHAGLVPQVGASGDAVGLPLSGCSRGLVGHELRMAEAQQQHLGAVRAGEYDVFLATPL